MERSGDVEAFANIRVSAWVDWENRADLAQRVEVKQMHADEQQGPSVQALIAGVME